MRFSRRANPKNQDDKKTTSNTCFGDLIPFWKASLRGRVLFKGRGKENKAVPGNRSIRRRTKSFLNRWYVLRVAILADTLLENSILYAV